MDLNGVLVVGISPVVVVVAAALASRFLPAIDHGTAGTQSDTKSLALLSKRTFLQRIDAPMPLGQDTLLLRSNSYDFCSKDVLTCTSTWHPNADPVLHLVHHLGVG